MPIPVTMGAQLMCNQGVAPSPLTVLPNPARPTVENRPAANVMDHIPNTNIMPFGMCRSLANPTVAAATAAALGVLTPMPCVPVTATPWTPGAVNTKVSGAPALTNNSQCQCIWGGSITVVQPGAVTTTVN